MRRYTVVTDVSRLGRWTSRKEAERICREWASLSGARVVDDLGEVVYSPRKDVTPTPAPARVKARRHSALGYQAQVESNGRVVFYAPGKGDAHVVAGYAMLKHGKVTERFKLAIPRDAAEALIRKIEEA